MNDQVHRFGRRYMATLRKYLRRREESVLEQAHELGRTALARKMGILKIVRLHGAARNALLRSPAPNDAEERDGAGQEAFLSEVLASFEAEHRGFGETTSQLHRAIGALEKRNLDLAAVNRRLESEINVRRRAETDLQISEGRLRAIFENSPVVIFLKDTRGRYVRVNRQFERLFGLRRREVLGRTDRDLFSSKQAAEFRSNDRKVLQAGCALEFEEVARYRDGVHVSIVSKFPLRDLNGDVYALCGIVTDITRRKEVEEALRQSKEHYRQVFNEAQTMQENLRRLSNQVLRAQEDERLRISRELHDEIGQSLTAVNMMLVNLGAENLLSSSAAARKRFTATQRLLGEAMENVHRFARELRPAMLDELGLLPALRSHFKSFSEHTGLQITFQTNSLAEKLNPEQKTVLFRVAQESLTNVAKHARASRVSVQLRETRGRLWMEISDNGRSFSSSDQDPARGRRGLGLLGMQERVRLVNGTFAVIPRRGQGTKVRVVLALSPAGHPSVLKPERRVRNAETPFASNGVLTPSAGRTANRYGQNPSLTG